MNDCESHNNCGEIINARCITNDECKPLLKTTKEQYEGLTPFVELKDIEANFTCLSKCDDNKKPKGYKEVILAVKKILEDKIQGQGLIKEDIMLQDFGLDTSCIESNNCGNKEITKMSQLLQWVIDKVCGKFGCRHTVEVSSHDIEFGYYNIDLSPFDVINTSPLDSSYTLEITVKAGDTVIEILNGNYSDNINSFTSNKSAPQSIKGYFVGNPLIEDGIVVIFQKILFSFHNSLFGGDAADINIDFILTDPETGNRCIYTANVHTVEQEAEYKTYNRYSELNFSEGVIIFNRWSNNPETSTIINGLKVSDGYSLFRNTTLLYSLINDSNSATISNVEKNNDLDHLIYSTLSHSATNCDTITPANVSIRQALWGGSSYSLSTLMTNFLADRIHQSFGATRIQIGKVMKDPVREHNGHPVYWLGGADCAQYNPYQLMLMHYTGMQNLFVVLGNSGDGEVTITDGLTTEIYPVIFEYSHQATAVKFCIEQGEQIFNDWGLKVRNVGTQIRITGDYAFLNTLTVSYANINADVQVTVQSPFEGWDIINFSEKIFQRDCQFPFIRRIRVNDIGSGTQNIRIRTDIPTVLGSETRDVFIFSGISGTCDITIDGTDYLMTFNTDIDTTLNDFVASHAATILSTHSITVTNEGFDRLRLQYISSLFPVVSVSNVSGDLTGGLFQSQILGIEYTVTFNTDPATTISDFMTAESANLLANHGITVTQIDSDVMEFRTNAICSILFVGAGGLLDIEGNFLGNSSRVMPQHVVNGDLYINVTGNTNGSAKNLNLFQQVSGDKEDFDDFSDPNNWDFMSLLAGSYTDSSGTANGIGSVARFGDAGQIVVLQEDSTRILDMLMEDRRNNSIRRLIWDGVDYIVSTFAGLNGVSGYIDGVGSEARFNQPRGLVRSGDWVYTHDVNNNVVRRININTALVETFSGTGDDNFSLALKF